MPVQSRKFRRVLTVCGLSLMLAMSVRVGARAESELPRAVIALYDSADEPTYRRSRLHRLVEMPLNHLGLLVLPHDIRTGLPSEHAVRNARGIVTWFSGVAVADARAYLAWLDDQIGRGKKLVLIDHPGVDPFQASGLANRPLFNRVMARLGLAWDGDSVKFTYASRIAASDPEMLGFERALPPLLPAYPRVKRISSFVQSHLAAATPGNSEVALLVATSPNGGYIAGEYAGHLPVDEWSWFVNPFQFFRRALATDDLPKPDTTTISGRRIYYSHVDGDGWHNASSVVPSSSDPITAAEVFYQGILLKYPDLPVTVAPITGDLDPAWYGTEAARMLARKIFELPHVEAGSHTHSHPFSWGYFRSQDPCRELEFLLHYPPRKGETQPNSVWAADKPSLAHCRNKTSDKTKFEMPYGRPRAYALKLFDLNAEIVGSVAALTPLLPAGKRVSVIQWSGDTSPYVSALDLASRHGLRNINGGDPRMDGFLRSYGQLSPLGLRVSRYWQVYSSGSNENVYTDGWRDRFFAFRGLVETLQNTETPIRIKPLNIYYHIYSADRQAGLSAVRHNLDFARGQEIAPIKASDFAAVVDGFYSARIFALRERRWRVEQRDGLQTIRFDHAATKMADLERSQGVIGQRHHQGSLYVLLDPTVDPATIALADHHYPHRHPDAKVPYLVSARWVVSQVEHGSSSWRFRSQGFGRGEFTWKTPSELGWFEVTAIASGAHQRILIQADHEGVLTHAFDLPGGAGVSVEISRIRD